jgi:hypothetical protein
MPVFSSWNRLGRHHHMIFFNRRRSCKRKATATPGKAHWASLGFAAGNALKMQACAERCGS